MFLGVHFLVHMHVLVGAHSYVHFALGALLGALSQAQVSGSFVSTICSIHLVLIEPLSKFSKFRHYFVTNFKLLWTFLIMYCDFHGVL